MDESSPLQSIKSSINYVFDTPKKIIIIAGIIVGTIILALVWKYRKNVEHFRYNDPRCAGHCRRNEDGTYNNAYDCCECIVLLDKSPNHQYGDLLLSDFWKEHRKCMCSKGYDENCYKLSTNFLLGF